jgi:hypothetical protein
MRPAPRSISNSAPMKYTPNISRHWRNIRKRRTCGMQDRPESPPYAVGSGAARGVALSEAR